ncbi:MAG: H-type small acid-soluble spore protein [Clostridia bacterium]|nr:H-type small acid-soluble spore protein [Clostridia bacterium]
MDSKRVNEIMESKGVINVNYNGMPVWIDNMKGDMAEVTLIGKNQTMSVPINNLIEV